MRKGIIYLIVTAVLALGVIAAITGVRYQKTVLKARESVLSETLARLRLAIKDYPLKQGSPPQSLDDLVKAGYIREVPDDPITGKKDWQLTNAEVEGASNKVNGIVDVHSASTSISSEGTRYSGW